MIKRRAQTITEYAVTIACVAAALVVMQAYFRRGLSGRLKTLVDSELGSQFDPWEGDYRSVTAQSGDTVEVTWIDQQGMRDENNIDWLYYYEYVYSVTGPQGYTRPGDGMEIIPPDPSRQPLRVSSYQDSTVDWENLGGGIGGPGGSGGSGGGGGNIIIY